MPFESTNGGAQPNLRPCRQQPRIKSEALACRGTSVALFTGLVFPPSDGQAGTRRKQLPGFRHPASHYRLKRSKARSGEIAEQEGEGPRGHIDDDMEGINVAGDDRFMAGAIAAR